MSDLVTFDADGYNLLESLLTAKTFVDRWTREYDYYRGQILKLVADKPCDIFYKGSRVASVGVSTPQRFNAEAFRAEHPALYQAYLHPGVPVTRLVPAKSVRPTTSMVEVGDE